MLQRFLCFFILTAFFIFNARGQELNRDIISFGTLFSPNQTYETYDLRIGAPPLVLNEKISLISSFRGQEGNIKLSKIPTRESLKNYRINLLTRIKALSNFTYLFNPHIEFKKISTSRNLSRDALFGSAMFLINYKPNDLIAGWRYGFGMHYSREFQSNTLIPIASAQYLGDKWRAELGFPFTGIYFFNPHKTEWGLRVQFDSNLYRYSPDPSLLLPVTTGLRVWRIDAGPCAQIYLGDSIFLRSSLGFLLLHEAHTVDAKASKQKLLAKKSGEVFFRVSLHYEKK
jgi:hypothetical protein